jgi:hypothetical protein
VKVVEAKVVTTRVTKRLELTGEDIRGLLEAAADLQIPSTADIYIQIPGGGDWSNTSLDVDKKNPIVITWEEIS